MTVRHLLALLTSVTMLHLMLVGGDAACATHGAADGRAMSSMTMQMAAPHHAAVPAHRTSADSSAHDGTAQPASDCGAPAQVRCCDAMSSCSVTTTVDAIERLVTYRVPTAGLPSLASSELESVPTAPEPPPPKA